MPLELPITISGFKPGFHRSLNGSRTESFSTDAIIRASLIAGHPEDGPALDPLITAWREASVRLALQLPASGRVRNMRGLVHPKAWKNLEPSEKAGVNNILGNTVTKLLSEKLLRAPRMWFLDLYKEEYKAVVKRPQRPDFFARTRDKQWVALEAKGRVNTPTTKSLRRAKSQARALTKVNGKAVVAHIVCWTMAKAKGLEARFHDPETRSATELSIMVDYNQLLRDYYRPIQEIIAASRPAESIGNTKLFWFDAGDFGVGLHPVIEQALQTQRPEQLINRFDNRRRLSNAAEDLHAGPDGIIVLPGRSWPTALEQPDAAVGS
jgi:hypothetical protein